MPAKPPLPKPNADELFKKWDSNSDGVLSKEEFIAGFQKMHGRQREAACPGFGAAMPPFGGPLRMPRFMLWGIGPQAGSPGEKPPFLWPFGGPQCGPPGKGPQAAPPGSMPPLPQVLSRLDKNKDCKITQDEVPAALWHRLSKADTNSDGVITKEELEATQKKLKERQPKPLK